MHLRVLPAPGWLSYNSDHYEMRFLNILCIKYYVLYCFYPFFSRRPCFHHTFHLEKNINKIYYTKSIISEYSISGEISEQNIYVLATLPEKSPVYCRKQWLTKIMKL